MKKWKLWAGLLVIFLSGIAIGFSLGGVHARKTVERMLAGEHPMPPELIVRKLSRELDLSDTQREYVTTVVCRAHSELVKVRLAHRPEVKQIIENSVSEIKEQLKPEQSQKLDALLAKARKRWERWEQLQASKECE